MSNSIRFVMDGRVHEYKDVNPEMTVLNFIRATLRRTATKEGCAEGDCGACTVVLGELEGREVRYRAVNACILFAPTLDGKELVTTESLKGPAGELHPVQRAMVDNHASQCGFCTPGFVMSMYAMTRNRQGALDRQAIDDELAGNLCRCTGYGPIIAAAKAAISSSANGPVADDPRAEIISKTAGLLESIKRADTLALHHKNPFTGTETNYFAPVELTALAALLEKYPDAVLLAGGTDVGLWVTKQHRSLGTIIYMGDVAELRELRVTGAGIEIGAGIRYADALSILGDHYPDMGEMIRRLGSSQIRNAGTIGGNIANGSPIGDTPPALIAAGATLALRKGREQRFMPLEDYFIAYGKQDRRAGEFVEKVILPLPKPGDLYRVHKISKRFDQDISAVCGAFRVTLSDGRVSCARIAFGGMAATPKRAMNCEAQLQGQPWDKNSIHRAMAALDKDFSPISDMRASAEYRRLVAKNLLMKMFIETTRSSVKTRLAGREILAHV